MGEFVNADKMGRVVATTGWRKLGSPQQTKLSMHNLATLVALLSLPYLSKCQLGHVTDMCNNGAIETAAHLVFEDGVERYFISNGPHYWFLNTTQDMPDAASATQIPYNFMPDVAILKNTRECPSGHLSLMLIQMKYITESNEAEWLTLEMKIGNWSDVEKGPVFWDQVNKIAHCDLDAQVCTTTDNYFATMSFDFKRKLSAAFGSIGETAYFIQDQNMYKVIYKNQCISNPYQEVIAYSAVPIGTTTTAALLVENKHSAIFFDNEYHTELANVTVDDFSFGDQFADVSKWQENSYYFFKQCPLDESFLSFLLMDVFSSSKKHFMKKRIIIITSVIVLLTIILLVLALIVLNLAKKRSSGNKMRDQSSLSETNEEQLIERLNVQIKSGENGEQQRTLLQTSC